MNLDITNSPEFIRLRDSAVGIAKTAMKTGLSVDQFADVIERMVRHAIDQIPEEALRQSITSGLCVLLFKEVTEQVAKDYAVREKKP